jgi:signal transduction histidine kinase
MTLELRTRVRPLAGRTTALSVALAGLTLATAAFALAAAPQGRTDAALLHGVMVAVPAVVAAAVLRRRPRDRFANLLLAATAVAALTVLSVSDDAVLYSTGRVAIWLLEPVLVYLLLSFPFGRLTGRAERSLFAAALAVDGVLYLPTALVVAGYPEPGPGTVCGVSCPHNAFAVTSADPAIVEDFVRPLREVLTFVVFAAVAVILARRLSASVPLGRRALAPVLATAIFRPVALGIYDAARLGGRSSAVLDVLAAVFLLSLPLIALGFAAGLVGARVYVATALERLTGRARAAAATPGLRAELAEALEDPSLQTAYRVPGDARRWVDDAGRAVPPLVARPGRAVTRVEGSGRIAAVEHDVVLTLEPGIVHGAATYAMALIETARLSGEREDQIRELAESRARIVTVGDQARRRIERDLHDGAQQRLVVLRANLAFESERLRADPARLADVLERLGDDVEETIDEVRSIAHGIYPSLLADRGLADAIRAAAFSAPIRTVVDAEGIGRYDSAIETTVYFACIEALQNAIKHAQGASGVWISLADDGRLRFTVRDDGVGFAAGARSAGVGLTNMRDRVAAVGGVLTIDTVRGQGTRVAGVVPVAGGRRRRPARDRWSAMA